MGIDTKTLGEIAALRATIDGPVAAVILGDCTFHTAWRSGDNRHDLAEFARRLSLRRAETLDLADGATIMADLYDEPALPLRGAFEMVIDSGTLYWCFDVAAAWRHCLSLLSPGGIIIHTAALTGYMGRGYYNFSPRLFRDFYAANGFEIMALKVRVRKSFSEYSPGRRLMARLFPTRDNYTAIEHDWVFLNAASWRGLHFGSKPEPQALYLPNDADILCAARRVRDIPFMRPMLTEGLL